ncbi:MAG TPA: zinc ABC transporter substrate-binding protein [Geobacteraceae bacterium]|nr:zinc ABC transporter substrate-binding protein [Geobacteraceae bacterium]
MKKFLAGALACLFLIVSVSCKNDAPQTVTPGKLHVVVSLFPLYDFTREIGGDKVDVYLLLPPGMEAHSFEPKPSDIIRANKADLFIYTNRYMEPWAEEIISGLDTRKTLVVDSSSGAHFLRAGHTIDKGHEENGHFHEKRNGAGMDPHIWLDFANARIMADNILAGLITKDPSHRAYYRENAERFKARLEKLDNEYRTGLSRCTKRTFLHGGHFAFGYLAHRYSLNYESAYAVSANAEPSPAKIARLIQQLRDKGLHYIYTEELVEPRISRTIARETGATILKLHGAHNISRDDLAAGATFVSLMEKNLKNLMIGLQCR